MDGGVDLTGWGFCDRQIGCLFFLFFLQGLGLGLAANDFKEDNPATVRASKSDLIFQMVRSLEM